MNYIFQNDGVIDIESITTFGVNAKTNDSAFGYFGTGLKYAIAVFARENIKFSIESDGVLYEFKVVPKEIRNKTFHFIYMNDVQLGFTTELGKNWQVWEAVREIYCNCMDEGGTYNTFNPYIRTERGAFKKKELPKNKEGSTRIIIDTDDYDITLTIMQFSIKENKNLKKLATSSGVEIYEGESDKIYYKGIACLTDYRTDYTYNIIQDLELTEDRTVKSQYTMDKILANAIRRLDNMALLESIIRGEGKESELVYDNVDNTEETDPSDEFLEVVKKLMTAQFNFRNESILRLYYYFRRTNQRKYHEKEFYLQKEFSAGDEEKKHKIEDVFDNIFIESKNQIPKLMIYSSASDQSEETEAKDGNILMHISVLQQTDFQHIVKVLFPMYLNFCEDICVTYSSANDFFIKKLISAYTR